MDKDAPGAENAARLSNIFPVFVSDYFSKKYGLRALVDQSSLDLLKNLTKQQSENLEVCLCHVRDDEGEDTGASENDGFGRPLGANIRFVFVRGANSSQFVVLSFLPLRGAEGTRTRVQPAS